MLYLAASSEHHSLILYLICKHRSRLWAMNIKNLSLVDLVKDFSILAPPPPPPLTVLINYLNCVKYEAKIN